MSGPQQPGGDAPDRPSYEADSGTAATTILPRHAAAKRSSISLVQFVVGVAVFALAAISLVGGWNTWRAQTDGTLLAEARTAQQPTVPATPVDDAASPGPSQSEPSDNTSKSPSSGSPKPSNAETKKPKPTAKPTDAFKPDRSVGVIVLNSTSRTGLAAAVAANLRTKGWTIIGIGNWGRTTITATKVYADGYGDGVATMRRDLLGNPPASAPLAGLRAGRITVILGPDYPRVS